MKFFKKHWGLFIVLFFSFWAISSFFVPGFFPMHDDTQVVRVSQMVKALNDGHFPVRWVKDLGYGYGYPLFNFYAPLPYYVSGLINIIGLNALDATKAMMIIGVLLSGIFMYFLAREFWGEVGGVVSGLFYLYGPYHAVDIYVRGAVGEFWAYGFIPLLFYGLWKLYKESRWRWVIVGAIGLAGVILSHNLTALMLLPFLIIASLLYCYIAYKNKKLAASGYLLIALLLGFGLSAFYSLPALLEMSYTNVLSQVGGGANFRDHFVCWQQLWDSSWGFGGSAPGCIDGLSFKIGKLHLITTAIALIGGIFLWKKDRSRSVVILFSTFYLLFSILMMLEIVRPLWETVSLMAFIQYPWRFLIIVTFAASFLAGALVWLLRYFSTVLYLSGTVLILMLLLMVNAKLFVPQTIMAKISADYINEYNVKWTTSKISDEYMPKDFVRPKTKGEVVKKRLLDKEIVTDKTQKLVFITNFDKEQSVLVNIAPFPAWRAHLDGTVISYKSKNNGIEVIIPSGEHKISLVFVSTLIEKISNAISLVSIVTILMLYTRLTLIYIYKELKTGITNTLFADRQT